MATKLHNLQKIKKARHKKRVGRGNASGKGTYSSRGIKGQGSRSGASGLKRRSLMKQFIKKTPKLGGFSSPNINTTITLAQIDLVFKDGDIVSLKTLQEKKLVTKKGSRAKIVNSGILSKKLIIDGVKATKTAQEEIKKVGGKIK